jgi:hypothetical protein
LLGLVTLFDMLPFGVAIEKIGILFTKCDTLHLLLIFASTVEKL